MLPSNLLAQHHHTHRSLWCDWTQHGGSALAVLWVRLAGSDFRYRFIPGPLHMSLNLLQQGICSSLGKWQDKSPNQTLRLLINLIHYGQVIHIDKPTYPPQITKCGPNMRKCILLQWSDWTNNPTSHTI
jgi:hypothetical protein